mmetsp:Transcript_30238/g.52351  ORF Transcript_30238/g.52351 Transcript_30238/m.52351 type:complete len:291 (+) Transcript_30238:178-1050(+)
MGGSSLRCRPTQLPERLWCEIRIPTNGRDGECRNGRGRTGRSQSIGPGIPDAQCPNARQLWRASKLRRRNAKPPSSWASRWKSRRARGFWGRSAQPSAEPSNARHGAGYEFRRWSAQRKCEWNYDAPGLSLTSRPHRAQMLGDRARRRRRRWNRGRSRTRRDPSISGGRWSRCGRTGRSRCRLCCMGSTTSNAGPAVGSGRRSRWRKRPGSTSDERQDRGLPRHKYWCHGLQSQGPNRHGRSRKSSSSCGRHGKGDSHDGRRRDGRKRWKTSHECWSRWRPRHQCWRHGI